MPRRKAQSTEPTAEPARRSARKRSSPDDGSGPEEEQTTSKRRRGENLRSPHGPHASHEINGSEVSGEKGQEEVDQDDDRTSSRVVEESEITPAAATPSRRRARKPKSETPRTLNGTNATTATPSSLCRQTAMETPVTKRIGTPSGRRIADRSARRKSARVLIDRVLGDGVSDDEEVDGDIIREIYESSASEDEEAEEDGQEERDDHNSQEEATSAAATPSKRPRGRPKKAAARNKSPTPPRDLPAHEQYFFQNKPGLAKTSNNSLSSLDLLTHEEYFTLLNKHKDPHVEQIRYLESLHAESFPQWAFELSQGFSICAYGYGSKKRLLHQFASYLHTEAQNHRRSSGNSNSASNNKIVIVNGYVRSTSARDILGTVASAIDPSYRLPAGNPAAAVQSLLSLLLSHPPPSRQQGAATPPTTLTLVVNSIDAAPMRKPAIQAALARLAAHPRVQLVCSADAADFALLWDGGLRASFGFAFHDATTFAPPSAAEADVIDEVRELLGRRTRRTGGREGVAFVLRSLPENARALFRLLVGEVLAAADDGGGGEEEGPGIEYRVLYNKAVEEFICSSEMAFRTLLKEFHDHQMITSHKDAIGTELLSLPFRRDELEAILEDLVS